MKPEPSIPRVLSLILTALAVAATSTMCLELSEFEPLLCTVEQSGQYPESVDILQMAKDLVSSRNYEVANFSINRTVISSENVFDFVKQGCSLLNPYCAAVITIASCPVVLVLDYWTAESSIPHLIYCTEHEPCHVTSSHSIHLAPDGPIKSDMVDILIKRILKWKELVFIYDDYLDMTNLAQLQFALSKSLVSYAAFNIHNSLTDQAIEDVINATKEMRHVFIAVNSILMDNIMEMANVTGLFTKDYEWIIMSNTSCLRALNKTLLMRSSTVFLRKIPFIHKIEDSNILPSEIDGNYTQEQASLLSAGMEAFLVGSSYGELYSKIHQSSSVCDKSLITFRKKAISETKQELIRTKEGFVIFDPNNGKVASYGFEFCSADDTSPNGYAVVGSWSPSDGLDTRQRLFKNAFKDFAGRKLLIGGMDAPPFVMKKMSGNRTYYEGFCIDLVNELASRLNFTFEIVVPTDEMWGAPDDNGTWGGVVGMVMRGEAEFAIGPLTITALREKVIDFTIPYLEDGIGILTKRAKLDSNAMFRLFTPLQPIVWTCLGASIIGASLILYCVIRKSPSSSDRSICRKDELTLFACCWAILGSTLNQGSEVQPKTNSGRLVLGSWWVFTIIFVSTYTANMAAVLTITIYDKPINNIAELASQSEIKPLVRVGSNIHSLFKMGATFCEEQDNLDLDLDDPFLCVAACPNFVSRERLSWATKDQCMDATNDIYRNIWKHMENMPLIRSNQDALTLVRNKNYALLTDRTQLEYIVLNDCETYALADDIFNTGGMGLIVPENAAFLNSFDLIIMKLQESGIIDGWRRNWWSARGSMCNANDRVSTVDQLDLRYLAGPFFIFLGTMTLSLLVVCIEKVWITDKCRRLRGRTLQANSATPSRAFQ